MDFQIDFGKYFPLRDMSLDFVVKTYSDGTYSVKLEKAEVQLNGFPYPKRLDLSDFSETEIDDLNALGMSWYEQKERWKKKEYNNDDLEIA